MAHTTCPYCFGKLVYIPEKNIYQCQDDKNHQFSEGELTRIANSIAEVVATKKGIKKGW
jgi:hypothetical protein